MDTSDFQIFANKNGVYAAPPEFVDRPLIRETFAKGFVYEPRTIEFICNMAFNGDVVSGGAWIGDFFPPISKALVPGALLHSVEPQPQPQPRSFAAAEMTIALNRLTNVRLHPLALGSEASKAELQFTNPETGVTEAAMAHIVKSGQSNGSSSVTVDVVRLDSLIPSDRTVSVIHFDLERFEPEALLGASAIIERCKPALVVEGLEVTEDWLNSKFKGYKYTKVGFFEENAFFVSLAAVRP